MPLPVVSDSMVDDLVVNRARRPRHEHLSITSRDMRRIRLNFLVDGDLSLAIASGRSSDPAWHAVMVPVARRKASHCCRHGLCLNGEISRVSSSTKLITEHRCRQMGLTNFNTCPQVPDDLATWLTCSFRPRLACTRTAR